MEGAVWGRSPSESISFRRGKPPPPNVPTRACTFGGGVTTIPEVILPTTAPEMGLCPYSNRKTTKSARTFSVQCYVLFVRQGSIIHVAQTYTRQ